MEPVLVTVELFGIPRHQAGCSEVSLKARTVGELLDSLEGMYPGLGRLRDTQGRLAGHLRLSLEGRTFVDEASVPLPPGACLLLLAADAGG